MQDKKTSLTFFSLSDDVIIKIYSNLPKETLANTWLVSQRSKLLSDNELLWELKLAEILTLTSDRGGLTAKAIYRRINSYLNYSDTKLAQAGKDSELNAELILKIPELAQKCGKITKCEFGKKYLSIAMILLESSEFLNEPSISFLSNMCKTHEEATLTLLKHPRLETLLSNFSENNAQLNKSLCELGKYPKAAKYIINTPLLSSKLNDTSLTTLRKIIKNSLATDVTIEDGFKTKLII